VSPRPVALKLITNPEAAGLARLLQCQHYDSCLDIAVARKWEGFGCAHCEAFEPRPHEKLRQDMVGMAKLWEDVGYHARIAGLIDWKDFG